MNDTKEFPHIHLGIDWQRNYLSSIGYALLTQSGGHISSSYPLDVKNQAVDIARKMHADGIITLWMAMTLASEAHFLRPSRKIGSHTLLKTRLAVSATPDEWVGNKHRNSVFSNSLLHPFLQKLKTRKLTLTGTETGKCLATSAGDALILGYEVDIPLGLTLDHDLAGVPRDQFDATKQDLLHKYFAHYAIDTTRLRMIPSDPEPDGKEKPASPLRAMPVLSSAKASL